MMSAKKTITVKYFALFREQAGVGEETIQLEAETALDVFVQTQSRHLSSEPYGHCKVAINDAMSDWSSAVREGDTVLLFPPVAGG